MCWDTAYLTPLVQVGAAVSKVTEPTGNRKAGKEAKGAAKKKEMEELGTPLPVDTCWSFSCFLFFFFLLISSPVDDLLRQMEAGKGAGQRPSKPVGVEQPTVTPLLRVHLNHLDSEIELKRMFGTKVRPRQGPTIIVRPDSKVCVEFCLQ
jgi:hypothetical protein